MPSRIRILDDVLADQIAAGEVVERPASAVKELLENAIDAGATEIHVSIEEGGRTLVRVSDNGCGMEREDALRSVQRHATSKIREPDDLFSIQTLGFRGEALPSIASVSRFRMTTRVSGEAEGTEVRVDGGKAAQSRPVGCAAGTTVEVRDLFYNVPARLKFLKAKSTESGHVAGACTRLALCNPALRLTLTRDSRTAREFLPTTAFTERVAEIFPGEALSAYELELSGMRVHAVLGPPERARSGAVALHLFVNDRPVKDLALARAIAFAYGSVLPPGRFPVGAAKVWLPPDEIDVNVHPQKSEVRFRDGRARFDALTRTLAKRLGTSAFRGPAARPKDYWNERLGRGPLVQPKPACAPASPAPRQMEHSLFDRPDPAGFATPPKVEATAQAEIADALADQASDPLQLETVPRPGRITAQTPTGRPRPTPPAAPHGLSSAPAASKGFFSSLRYVGQVRRMLLLCEGNEALYMIDQHAADERVRYDRFRRAYAAGTVKTQRLLFPERVECEEREMVQLERCQEDVLRAGLETTVLGPSTIAIHTVPALLQRAAPERLLRDLVAELHGQGDRAFGDAVDTAIATMACHAAVRAGDALSADEVQALLRSLDQVQEFGGHCPHGRPVAFDIAFSDLERRLGR